MNNIIVKYFKFDVHSRCEFSKMDRNVRMGFEIDIPSSICRTALTLRLLQSSQDALISKGAEYIECMRWEESEIQ